MGMQVISEEGEEIKDDTFVNEVKLQKYASNIYGLNRNGHAMRCPIIPPTMMQVMDQGQPKMAEQSKPCNSNCPLFLIRTKTSGGYLVTIGCGSVSIEHEVKEIAPYITKK